MDISLNKIFIVICLGAVFILLNNLRLVQYDVEKFKSFQQLKKLSQVLDLKNVLPKKQFNVSKWYKEMLEQVNTKNKISVKIYVYELPKKFNRDILSCFYPSLNISASYKGMGPEVYTDQQLSMHLTPKHSLEWLIHEKLLTSSYRTRSSVDANVFYIPAYLGLACSCIENEQDLTKELFRVLKNVAPFRNGKLHLTTLAEIEPRKTLSNCSLFKHPLAHWVSYISTRKNKLLISENNDNRQKLIITPYSSSAHLQPEYSLNENTLLRTNSLEERLIQVFMADTESSTSLLNSKIKQQFKMKTRQSFEKFNNSHKVDKEQAILLIIPERKQDVIMKWMQQSIFCLQPAGYSLPGKLFFDAIMCGCIPVIFNDNHTIDFPFQNRLNYSSFMYTIHSSSINTDKSIIQILDSVSDNIRQKLHKNLLKVAHWLQYSLPDNNTHAVQYDALSLIVNELSKMLN